MVNESSSIINVMGKLALVQQKLKVTKKHYNSFSRVNYRNAADIVNALKPILAEYKCTIYMTDEIVNYGEQTIIDENEQDDKKGVTKTSTTSMPSNYIKATVYFVDIETGEKFSVSANARESVHKGMSGEQWTVSASTYARKCALMGMFLVDDEDDSNNNGNNGNNGNGWGNSNNSYQKKTNNNSGGWGNSQSSANNQPASSKGWGNSGSGNAKPATSGGWSNAPETKPNNQPTKIENAPKTETTPAPNNSAGQSNYVSNNVDFSSAASDNDGYPF